MSSVRKMLPLFVSLLFFCLFKNTLCDLNYTVAVVEYHTTTNETINLENYLNVLKSLDEGVNVIVFPESTLSTRPFEVPAQGTQTNCTAKDLINVLGCAAQQKQAYIVVNLLERVNCTQNCTQLGYVQYNTDVVFSKEGAILATYRKWNLFAEPGTSRPKNVEIVTFDTEWGKFGIFTCFDLMFREPTLNLIEMGVKNIIFPTMWFAELPFLTALQSQQMFAHAHNVNLLAANSNNYRVGSAGSGIYPGNLAPLQMTVATEMQLGEYKILTSNQASANPPENVANLDKFVLLKDNLTQYNSLLVDLGKQTIEETVCQGALCCQFKLQLSVNGTRNSTQQSYFYRLAVFEGVRTFSSVRNGGMEICAVISCTDAQNVQSCTQRFPNLANVTWDVTFDLVHISAKFANTKTRTQYPNSLQGNFHPLSPIDTTWSRNVSNNEVHVTFATRKPVQKLHTFAIFGRDFARDDASGATQLKLYPFLGVFIVIFKFLL